MLHRMLSCLILLAAIVPQIGRTCVTCFCEDGRDFAGSGSIIFPLLDNCDQQCGESAVVDVVAGGPACNPS